MIGASDVGFGILFVALLVASIFITLNRRGRAEEMIDRWASSNGLRILDRQVCRFWKGPFIWTASKSQMVFYVSVEDDAGETHNAYVRVGGWVIGLLSDRVDVEWEN